jgi:hypothetical protein
MLLPARASNTEDSFASMLKINVETTSCDCQLPTECPEQSTAVICCYGIGAESGMWDKVVWHTCISVFYAEPYFHTEMKIIARKNIRPMPAQFGSTNFLFA